MKKFVALSAVALLVGVTGASAAQHRRMAGPYLNQSWSHAASKPSVFGSASRPQPVNSGPYHEDVLPDGTVTGPLQPEANGG
jgi:hypothetical protein